MSTRGSESPAPPVPWHVRRSAGSSAPMRTGPTEMRGASWDASAEKGTAKSLPTRPAATLGTSCVPGPLDAPAMSLESGPAGSSRERDASWAPWPWSVSSITTSPPSPSEPFVPEAPDAGAAWSQSGAKTASSKGMSKASYNPMASASSSTNTLGDRRLPIIVRRCASEVEP